MTYMTSHDQFTACTSASAEQVRSPATFSALEWNVIALARRDSLSSLDTPGLLSKAMGGLFGRGTSSILADPRLEALRRLAVHAWHRGFAVPVSEIARFKLAGFTIAQVEALLASIGAARDTPRRRVLAA